MEQRPLRLGDILDDYCPRERRVTNHAIVAMLDDAVKQTRCTTCDAEHPYKGGKAPRRRVKAPSVDVPAAPPLLAPPVATPVTSPEPFEEASVLPAAAPKYDEPADAPAPLHAEAADDGDVAPPQADEGPVHRRLIRATLPRPEGQKEARALPDFTVRQPTGRSGHGNGNGNHRNDNRGNQLRGFDRAQRFGARGGQPGRGGQPRGQHAGTRSSQPPQHRRSGRKRSR